MRCKAIKRDGSRCSLPAARENGFCWAHDPANAEQRRRAASKAGKTKPSAELHQIKRQLRNIADEVLEGEITTAKGSVAAQVLGVYLRAVEQERKNFETQELADRLEQLEAAYGGGNKRWG
jgi:hypothetical protein